MKSKLLSGLICSLIIVVCSSTSGETVTLQQGVNGYSGCEDSWFGTRVWASSYDLRENYGTASHLIVDADNYRPD